MSTVCACVVKRVCKHMTGGGHTITRPVYTQRTPIYTLTSSVSTRILHMHMYMYCVCCILSVSPLLSLPCDKWKTQWIAWIMDLKKHMSRVLRFSREGAKWV